MPSERRLEKITMVLMEELSRIVDRDMEFPQGTLVTVTRVMVSSDNRYADVFISVLGGDEKPVMEILEKNVYDLQQELNKRLRMRPVPKIRFLIDEGEAQRAGVEKALIKLKKSP